MVLCCVFFFWLTSQDNDSGRWSRGHSGRPAAAAARCQVGEENVDFDSLSKVHWYFLIISPDCRSFPSSLWSTDSALLSQVTSLSSSFAPNPRMHHLPTFSYTSHPTAYGSYLSAPPPPPLQAPQATLPPATHCGSFQPSSFYFGQNQQLHSVGEERSVVTALTGYIEGACLSLRGEEPVWRPYWSAPIDDLACWWVEWISLYSLKWCYELYCCVYLLAPLYKSKMFVAFCNSTTSLKFIENQNKKNK